MPAISIQDLENAKTDVDHIADVATSLAPTATDRLGHVKQTLAGAVGGNAELDVFLTRVTYPGHRDGFDYAYTELEGKLTFAEKFYVGAAYSPDIFNLGGHGIYMNAGVSLPLGETGFDLTAQVGHYNLNDAAGDSYNDYLLGIGRDFGPLRADLQYTDTSSYGEALSDALDDASQADGRVALMLTWAF